MPADVPVGEAVHDPIRDRVEAGSVLLRDAVPRDPVAVGVGAREARIKRRHIDDGGPRVARIGSVGPVNVEVEEAQTVRREAGGVVVGFGEDVGRAHGRERLALEIGGQLPE